MSANNILNASNLWTGITVNTGQVISANHNNQILNEIRNQKNYSENQANRNLGGTGFGSQYFENSSVKSRHIDLQAGPASLSNQESSSSPVIGVNQAQYTGNAGNFNITWETLDMRAFLIVEAEVALEVPWNCQICEFGANLELFWVHSGVTHGPITHPFRHNNSFNGKIGTISQSGINQVLTKTTTHVFFWSPTAIDASTNFYFRAFVANYSSLASTGFNAKLSIRQVSYQTFHRFHP